MRALLLFQRMFRAILLVGILGSLSLPVPAQYTITDLGTLGGNTSGAWKINQAGHVTGSSTDGTGLEHAFLWKNGQMIDLGTLAGYGQSIGVGLNNHDDVAGQVLGAPYPTSKVHAALFQNGVVTDIGVLSGTTTQSHALGINDNGQVVGYSGLNGASGRHAILWDQAHGLQDLTPGNPSEICEADSINNAGQIVGTRSSSVFLYSGGVMTDISTATGIFFYPNKINDVGQIVGFKGVASTAGNNFGNGVLWQNGQAVILGRLSGFGGSTLTDINNLGVSVGNVFNLNGAVITTQSAILCVQSQLIDLNTLIPANSGWQLTNASGINDSGQIVGQGVVNGQKHAYLLTPAALTLGVTPNTILGGQNVTGCVLLAAPAPSGGAVVTLSSANSAVVSLPETVTVPAGSTAATFSIGTSPVAADTTVSLSAAFDGATSSVNLTVQPATVTSLAVAPAFITGSQSATGTVKISGPAPAGGLPVALSSSNSAVVSLPATVTVAAGATTATFTVTTVPVPANNSVVLSATRGTTATATLLVRAPGINGLDFNPQSVHGGRNTTGIVSVDGPAPPGGIVISLASSNTSLASCPSTVTIAAGTTVATFPVTTHAVSTNTLVNMSASFNGAANGTTLKLTPPDLTALTLTPAVVKGSLSSIGTVSISDPAATGGLTVTLSSDNAAATVPASVVIPAGATSVTFTVNTSAVAADTVANITGTFNTQKQKGALAILVRLPFDFDNDGRNDLIFQNAAANDIVVWFANGLDIVGGAPVNYVPPAGWLVVGCADINHDRSPDLFMQNQQTGQINVWYMQGTSIIGGKALSFAPSAGYRVVGIGDFNGDGNPDILFQQETTGQLAIWYLNGSAVAGGVSVPQIPADGYRVVGVGDMDADGKPDIVFQNQASNQVVVWYMNGSQFTGGGAISYLPPTDWKVKGIEDLDNDGKADLVFQNQATNQLLTWFMDGLTVRGGGTMSLIPLADYKLRGPH